MGEGEELQGSPALTCNIGQLCYMLTVVSAGLLRVSSRLLEIISMSAFTVLEFAMLCSGATISDGGKSERSNELHGLVRLLYFHLFIMII